MSDTGADSGDRFYKHITEVAFSTDIELQGVDNNSPLRNDTVKSFIWNGITVTVKDQKTKQPKAILDGVDGIVEVGMCQSVIKLRVFTDILPGEICALMGPSGCGKTTLLNVLAQREATDGVKVGGHTLVNGTAASLSAFRQLSSYVEQEDALIGSLTVRETLHFAARLAHKNSLSSKDRKGRIEGLLDSFGLRNQSNTIIGTPIQKGISGGQKRRVSVASQLITGPKILFLDEPTSGLDSAASLEVIAFVKKVAKQNNLIVLASIHQPSTATFRLFDKLVLLSGGKQHYFGPVDGVGEHFGSLGFPMPAQVNPAEFLLEIMNIDFASHQEAAEARLNEMQKAWAASTRAQQMTAQMVTTLKKAETLPATRPSRANFPVVLMTLVHRSFVKSYRDVVAYGIRIAMYTGLAIMMGTVWLRIHTEQEDIQPFINAIFFGSAFMSFMAVAYVPSYLEDRATFVKERHNGLYGPASFILSNFIIGLPYLFLISLIFSSIAYWLSNFQPTAQAFFTWIMWLFLDLVAAESLVVLMSSIFPNFVVSLALTAFANGLWMSVGGFLVTPTILNVFWKYVFHYIDYQSYVFQGMMVNEFQHRTYGCGKSCQCIYQSDLADQCRIAGTAVLDLYDYKTGQTGKWVGILLGIVLGYRLLGWVALYLRK